MMHRRHQDILTRNRLLLVRSVKMTNTLLACLREDYTLTEEMEQEVQAERTNSEKVGALLDILIRRGDKAFDRFIRALIETDHDKIAHALDEGLAEKYVRERDSNRMEVQESSENNTYIPDQRPVLRGGQPASWPVMMSVNGQQSGYPFGMVPVMMPVMYTMQNMMPPVHTANVSLESTSASSRSLTGAAVAHPSDQSPFGVASPELSIAYPEDELKDVLKEINGKDAQEIMKVDIRPTTNLHLTEDPMVYQIRSLPRGRAVIINNRYFVSQMGNRYGAEHDTENLQQLFEQLSFTVIVEKDLTAEEIRNVLTKESKHPDHEKADMFVLFLLSHGSQGNIYGIDGEKLSIEDGITTLFDPDGCPALKGKPKVFFIQACQGSMRASNYAPDSDKFEPPDLDENLIKSFEKVKIEDRKGFVPGFHKKSDMVMSYATVKGYLAWRRSDLGSWFVRCLVAVFSRRAHCCHLIDMLTEANFLLSQLETSEHEGHSRQLAEKTDTLIKKLYFFPGAGSAAKPE